jgi:hypothetical protein
MNVHVGVAPVQTSLPGLASADGDQFELLHAHAVIGNNHPPEPIEPVAVVPVAPAVDTRVQTAAINSARCNYVFVSEFLRDVPVIETHEHAVKAANFIEQARKTVQDMEAERRGQVDPLNAQVKSINDDYRLPRESIEGLCTEIKRRLKVFTDAEEVRRAAEAERLRLVAEEAERVAREAEAREQQTMLEADCGVITDVAGAIVEADKTFNDFLKTDRAAQRAAKQTKVRLNGGFGRTVSMRPHETLLLHNAVAAIEAMGVTEAIKDAILTSARAYRKLNGHLPAGVKAETERKY